MKNLKAHILFFLVLFLFSGIHVFAQSGQEDIHKCALSAGPDATYLKDFVVKLNAAVPGQPPPIYRQSLALRKNVTYRFSICNKETSAGEAVLRLYDGTNLILRTWYPETGKEYPTINFECRKSGVYTVMISFKNGNQGEAIGILSYVE